MKADLTNPELLSVRKGGSLPLLAVALHDGHRLREELLEFIEVSEDGRLREEDPFTGIWTGITGNSIVANFSRFEFDLNRKPKNAVYLLPEQAWGIRVWRETPPDRIILDSEKRYGDAYNQFRSILESLVLRYGKLVVYDLHSYNHRRNGPGAQPEDPLMNPEINVGTGTMDRVYWAPLIDRFIHELKIYNFGGRELDVRENIKFKGGHFPGWIHTEFGRSVCCISIEVKKFFMDEWTGQPDRDLIRSVGEALSKTIPGVISELTPL